MSFGRLVPDVFIVSTTRCAMLIPLATVDGTVRLLVASDIPDVRKDDVDRERACSEVTISSKSMAFTENVVEI